jgi:hypothetical protein
LKRHDQGLLSYVYKDPIHRRPLSMKPIVIIGAVAAGMSAASVLKREIKDLKVMVFGKEHYISYSA